MHCYVWEFHVRPEHIRAFEAGYGAEGEWGALFRNHPGWVRTELVRDAGLPTRFLTIDYWKSREALESFRKEFQMELEALDVKFETLTSSETFLGAFDVIR